MAKKTISSDSINILLYGYSPAITSGMSTLTRQLANMLIKIPGVKLHVYGINDSGNPKNQKEYPYPIYRFAGNQDSDIYTRNHFSSVILGEETDLQPPFDIIITTLAPHILINQTNYHHDGVIAFLRNQQKEAYVKKTPDYWFKTIGYFPIDHSLDSSHLYNCIAISDQPVSLSQYGRSQILDISPGLETSLETIPISLDTQTYKPLPSQKKRAFRDEFFRGEVAPSTFLITSVAKNYYLNDLTRTLKIFRDFHQKYPNSFLYLHTDPFGPFVDLVKQAKQFGLEELTDWAYAGNLSQNKYSSREDLNLIYNASDVILSTSQATWWGNVILESFATKTPVIAPYHSAFSEHLSDSPLDDLDMHKLNFKNLRGLPLAKNPNDSSWISYGSADNHLIRPLVSDTDTLQKLEWVHQQPKELGTIINQAFKYAKLHHQKHIFPIWKRVIMKQFKQLKKERQDPQATISKYFG